jgi:hypothetical protein
LEKSLTLGVGQPFYFGIVGMCGAVIVYFFLQSGIISGSVIPNFHKVGIDSFIWPGTMQGHSVSLEKPIMLCIVLPIERWPF